MAVNQLDLQPQVSEIPRLIDWVEACCNEEAIADDIRFKVTLALEEAVMNVLSHGFAGVPPPHLIRIRLDIGADALVAEVIDNGSPFDPTSVPDPDLSLPLDQRRPGGLGVYLIRGMMDRVHYLRRDGSNVLRLEKTRGNPAA